MPETEDQAVEISGDQAVETAVETILGGDNAGGVDQVAFGRLSPSPLDALGSWSANGPSPSVVCFRRCGS